MVFPFKKNKNLSLKKNKYVIWRYSQVRVAGTRTQNLNVRQFLYSAYDLKSPQKEPPETSELEVMYRKWTCVYLLIWFVLLLLLLLLFSMTRNQNLTISLARYLSFFTSFFFKLSIKLGVVK